MILVLEDVRDVHEKRYMGSGFWIIMKKRYIDDLDVFMSYHQNHHESWILDGFLDGCGWIVDFLTTHLARMLYVLCTYTYYRY